MMADLGESIRDALVDFLSPLQEAGQNPGAMTEWLAKLGQTRAIAADPALLHIAEGAAALVEELSAFDAETLDSWAGISGVLDMGEKAAEIRAALRQFASDPARAQVAGALAEEVMALLLASYLRRRHGTFFRVAALLTLIEPRETSPTDPPLVQDGRTLRYARLLDRFKFGAVSDLVSHPGPALAEAYFPNDLAAASDAWSAAAALYPISRFWLMNSAWPGAPRIHRSSPHRHRHPPATSLRMRSPIVPIRAPATRRCRHLRRPFRTNITPRTSRPSA